MILPMLNYVVAVRSGGSKETIAVCTAIRTGCHPECVSVSSGRDELQQGNGTVTENVSKQPIVTLKGISSNHDSGLAECARASKLLLCFRISSLRSCRSTARAGQTCPRSACRN